MVRIKKQIIFTFFHFLVDTLQKVLNMIIVMSNENTTKTKEKASSKTYIDYATISDHDIKSLPDHELKRRLSSGFIIFN